MFSLTLDRLSRNIEGKLKPVYIKYLIESVSEVFNENFGIIPEKGKVSFYTHGLTADVAASIRLVGDLEGDIILMIKKDVALKIASMMFQEDVSELDELSLSSITELVNFIAGRMITKLFQLDYNNDITPPEILVGKSIEFDYSQILACKIEFESDLGNLEFALAKKKK